MSDNSVKDIKDYFSTPEKPVSTGEMMEFWKSLSTPEKPVSTGEMMEFWKSLSDGEKDYYKNADLSQ